MEREEIGDIMSLEYSEVFKVGFHGILQIKENLG